MITAGVPSGFTKLGAPAKLNVPIICANDVGRIGNWLRRLQVSPRGQGFASTLLPTMPVPEARYCSTHGGDAINCNRVWPDVRM